MNNPFEKIKAPRRTTQEIESTYKSIEQRLQTKKKRSFITNGALLASIAAILLFLLSTYDQTSYNSAASNTSIQKIYLVDYDHSLYPIQGVEKWYYLNKHKIDSEQLKKIIPVIERVDESEAMTSDNYRVPTEYAFIVVHADDSVSYYFLEFEEGGNWYLRNEITDQQTKLTIEEYLHSLPKKVTKSIPTQILYGVLLTLVYLLYLKMMPKISPSIRRNLFKKENLMELIRAYIIMKITTFGLLILIMWVNPALNLFVMIGAVSFIILLRIGKEYYDGNYKRSIWEVPISIVTYTLILYLLHF